jgi:hypothetical protein
LTRLLFCWELGSNLGHLSNVAALLPRLQESGYVVEFAVADLKVARQVLGPDVAIYQAPVWPPYAHTGATVGLANFSDVLALIGFGAPPHLDIMVGAWLHLISVARPAVILADHSPAAQVAAGIAGRPVVALGSGFTMPPLEADAFPPWPRGARVSDAGLPK